MRATSLTTAAMPEEIEKFRAYLREEKMRAVRTVACYVAVMEDFRRFLEKRHPGEAVVLEAVSTDELTQFLREVANDRGTPSPATWNSRLAALRAFFGHLVRAEAIELDPTRQIDRQKTHPSEPIPLSPEEYFDLLDVLAQAGPSYRTRDTAIISVLFHTGLRVAELVSLDLAQVDLRNHLFLEVLVKGQKRIHKRMNDQVAEAVEHYLADREGLEPKDGETALFLSDRGTRLAVRSVQELVATYGERAGLSRPLTPHMLRHSSASVLSEIGVPIPAIQRHLGHASARTTERYIHPRDPSHWVVNELGEHMTKLAKKRTKGGEKRKRLRSRVAAYSASKRN